MKVSMELSSSFDSQHHKYMVTDNDDVADQNSTNSLGFKSNLKENDIDLIQKAPKSLDWTSDDDLKMKGKSASNEAISLINRVDIMSTINYVKRDLRSRLETIQNEQMLLEEDHLHFQNDIDAEEIEVNVCENTEEEREEQQYYQDEDDDSLMNTYTEGGNKDHDERKSFNLIKMENKTLKNALNFLNRRLEEEVQEKIHLQKEILRLKEINDAHFASMNKVKTNADEGEITSTDKSSRAKAIDEDYFMSVFESLTKQNKLLYEKLHHIKKQYPHVTKEIEAMKEYKSDLEDNADLYNQDNDENEEEQGIEKGEKEEEQKFSLFGTVGKLKSSSANFISAVKDTVQSSLVAASTTRTWLHSPDETPGGSPSPMEKVPCTSTTTPILSPLRIDKKPSNEDKNDQEAEIENNYNYKSATIEIETSVDAAATESLEKL